MKINGVPEEYRGEYKEAKELLKKSSILSNEAYKTLWEIEGIVLGNVLRDYSILNESVWTAKVTGKNNNLSLCSDIYSHNKLSDIFREDYHCDLEIADGIKLQFYDNDIILYSNNGDDEVLVKFVKDYKVDVYWKYLDVRIEVLKKDLSEVIELRDFLKLTFG